MIFMTMKIEKVYFSEAFLTLAIMTKVNVLKDIFFCNTMSYHSMQMHNELAVTKLIPRKDGLHYTQLPMVGILT